MEVTQFEYRVAYRPPRRSSRFWFSPTETRHLSVSALLVMGVGLSMSLVFFPNSPVEILLFAAFISPTSFLVHEIAHKLVAQHYGLWAEFRLTLFGAFITLLSIVSPFFKIISPGAVMIAGAANKETIGKTSLAGSLTNIVISFASFTLAFVAPTPFLEIAVFCAVFNAMIAILNLMPIGILDGYKVFRWSKTVWALSFALSLILVITTFARYLNVFPL